MSTKHTRKRAKLTPEQKAKQEIALVLRRHTDCWRLPSEGRTRRAPLRPDGDYP